MFINAECVNYRLDDAVMREVVVWRRVSLPDRRVHFAREGSAPRKPRRVEPHFPCSLSCFLETDHLHKSFTQIKLDVLLSVRSSARPSNTGRISSGSHSSSFDASASPSNEYSVNR